MFLYNNIKLETLLNYLQVLIKETSFYFILHCQFNYLVRNQIRSKIPLCGSACKLIENTKNTRLICLRINANHAFKCSNISDISNNLIV